MPLLESELAAPWRLRVDVYRVRHEMPTPMEVAEWTYLDGDQPFTDEPEGVFLIEGIPGGRSEPPVRSYNASIAVEQILTDVSRLRIDNPDALLGFINEWGLLGCAAPDHAIACDSVARTRMTLHLVRRLLAWLSAMQHRQFKSRAIPSRLPFREEHPFLRIKRLPPFRGSREEWSWWAFAMLLDEQLRKIPLHAFVVPPTPLPERFIPDEHWRDLPMTRKPQTVLVPRCLADVLFLELWRRASDEQTVLRKCPGCDGLFPVSVTNTKRRYCADRCKNQKNFRRWYSHPENRAKLGEKRRCPRQEV